MHKMCPRCGVVFEVKSDAVFCSEKCKTLFRNSGLDALKGRPSGGYLHSIAGRHSHHGPAEDGHTEIIRPHREKR